MAVTALVGLSLCALETVKSAGVDSVAAEALRSTLRRQLSLSDSEMQSLRHGRPIVKTMTPAMGRELNTAGGVRIQSGAMARFVNDFKTLQGFKTSQFIKQIEKFSDPPRLSDLDALIVEQEDIDALRECRVAACDVQLAAEDIKRFNGEVNWRAADAPKAAAVLYKAVLFAHLENYRTGGVERLLAYQDREAAVRLAGETSDILAATPSILEQVPAFHHHIRRYPAGANANTENFFYWSKESFGFKPVVVLNHVNVYTDPDTGNVLIATTQIYASHYLDGSVGIHALLPDSMSTNEPGFYWLYTNRTRIGRLAGFLGTISRPIVQRRARAGLLKSMQQTKQRFEASR